MPATPILRRTMSPPNSATYAYSPAAAQILNLLKPASVFGVGPSVFPLLDALAAQGVRTGREASSPEHLDAVPGRYDLVVCGDLNGPAERIPAVLQKIALLADRVLLCGDGLAEDPHAWLRLFGTAGLCPDLTSNAVFLTQRQILFSKGATCSSEEGLALTAEVLRLNAAIQECSAQAAAIQRRLLGGAAGEAPDSASLEKASTPAARQEQGGSQIDDLRLRTVEALKTHRAFADRVNSQVAELQMFTSRFQYAIPQLQRDIQDLRRSTGDLQRFTQDLERSIQGLQGSMEEILRSRIWRILVAGGGLLLAFPRMIQRLVSGKSVTQLPSNTENAREAIRLGCDEPRPDIDATGAALPPRVISGILSIRGWAVAASGIQRVEIQAGDAPPIEAIYGLYRPDVGTQFQNMPGAELSGFRANLDTSPLPDGGQSFVIRAVSSQGTTAETRVPLLIDHVNGYASEYLRWIAEFEEEDNALIVSRLPSFTLQPTVSIIVPVYRTSPEILERTIGSVLKQSYPNWELCLADDCSRSKEVDAVLGSYSELDKRIKVTRLPVNGGISAASNAAMAMASGEFLALLDHDDEFAEHALCHFVDALNREPEADVFYSDEDHIDESGLRSDPFFKPDWSPDLILSENYVTHLMIFRRSLAREVGGFRSDADLSQDHDILLRMSTKARKIVHIPKVLYHWRTEMPSLRRASSRTDQALASSRLAVADHLHSIGAQASVEPGERPQRWRIRYAIPEGQIVRIVVPCGGKVELLDRCLESIAEKTDYQLYEIVVVDNSHSDQVERFVARWNSRGRSAGYLDFRHREFNYSAMNNAAARDTTAALLLFLNDDISIITPGWLTAMVELASRPDVGAVGAKLLYPDDTIQHAGVALGIYGVGAHAFKGVADRDATYFDFPHVIRNVSAVTGACMMVPAKRFWECGGFDAEALPVAYQDIDLCLKLRQKGYRVLFTPHARLYHYEGISKRPQDMDPRPAETLTFKTRWQKVIDYDPFYSPNLTRMAEDYSYRKKRVW